MIQLPPMQTGGARGPMTSPERIEADYLLETAFDPGQAAAAMAGEQSSGTFVPVPGETPELKARAAARIEALRVLDDEVREPSAAVRRGAEGRAGDVAPGSRHALVAPRQSGPLASQPARDGRRKPVRA